MSLNQRYKPTDLVFLRYNGHGCVLRPLFFLPPLPYALPYLPSRFSQISLLELGAPLRPSEVEPETCDKVRF